MLYLAYGSNLDMDRIKERCPSVKYFKRAMIKDYKLVFMTNGYKGVANIVKSEGSVVYGVIYEISEKDLKELDRYEGHPFVYKRVYFKQGNREVISYAMDGFMYVKGRKYPREFQEPTEAYLRYIERGYEYYKLPKKYLYEALENSTK